MQPRNLILIQQDINNLWNYRTTLECYFPFGDFTSMCNKFQEELDDEKRAFILKSKQESKTYEQALGFENLNWQELLASASTHEDWEKLEILASIYPRNTGKYFGEVYPGLTGIMDVVMQGSIFYEQIQKQDKQSALIVYDRMIESYN
ncbi:hypothetical protein IT400_00745 [Candidatus Nomurabacteria bacterium]|nr:hypothetical protein [Candidatus Nomurabacteria bacterium]